MGASVSGGGDLSGGSAQLGAQQSSDAFSLAVEEEGATLYLRLTGEFAWGYIGRVEAALERVCASTTRRVVFDLRELSFLDLAGLKTILRANERARVERFDVVVVRPKGYLNRVFTLTRAGERLTMVDRFARGGFRHSLRA